MTRKTYRTAQGRIVDLGALQLQNEHVRAVGNMSVNARGDLIDSWNRPVDSRNQQVAKQYKKQTSNVEDTAVQHNPALTAKKTSKKSAKAEPVVDAPAPPEDFEDNFEKPVVNTAPTAPPVPEGGLAAAIARARQIKQDPLKTPREIAQHKSGVNKV